jgi:hypothetical protein
LNKNNNLIKGTTNNIQNFYENLIKEINIQDLYNQLKKNIKSHENDFGKEAPIKLNDNFLHNRPFFEENIREELNNPEEIVNNGQNENIFEKYENTEKESINEIKIIEENNIGLYDVD